MKAAGSGTNRVDPKQWRAGANKAGGRVRHCPLEVVLLVLVLGLRLFGSCVVLTPFAGLVSFRERVYGDPAAQGTIR